MSSWFRWHKRLHFRWSRFWYSLRGYVKIQLGSQRHEQEREDAVEVVWAKQVGKDLYQLENIPFTEELNLHDVVRCEERPDEPPVAVEVLRRSGNRTLRVSFQAEVPVETAAEIVSEVLAKKAFYERAGERQFMFNVGPEMEYETIRDYLRSKEAEGLLWLYE